MLTSDRLATVAGMISSGAAAGFLFRELPLSDIGIQFVRLKKPIVTDFCIQRAPKSFGGEAVNRLCAFLEAAGQRITSENKQSI